jgi:hypothetical protein
VLLRNGRFTTIWMIKSSAPICRVIRIRDVNG